MEVLVVTHGAVRWLVFAGAAVTLLAALSAASPGRASRVPGAVFVALLDLQSVLGLILLVIGRGARRDALIHGVVMLGAVTIAHVLRARSKRSAAPSRVQLVMDVLAPMLLVALGLRFLGS
jgi:hypothetical protein